MKPVLGFVGLGNMGLPMCRRLIDQGYTVFLYDVNEEQGFAKAGHTTLYIFLKEREMETKR